jgi:hypothetical protein
MGHDGLGVQGIESNLQMLRSLLRRLWSPALLLCVVMFVDLLVLQSKEGDKQISGDGFYTYLWARSLVFDHDLRLTNDLALCGDQFELVHWQKPGLEPPNWWGVGGGLATIPFLMVARYLWPPAELTTEAASGCSGPIARFAMTSTALLAVLSVYLAYRIATRYVRPRHALIGMAIAAFGSPLYCYAYKFSAHSMVPSAFATVLFVHEWDRRRGKRGWLGWCGLGALMGLLVLVRTQSVAFVLLAVVEWAALACAARRQPRELRRLAVFGVLFTLCAAVVYSPQLYANMLMFGHLGDGRARSYMFWTEPELAGPLFFPYSGLLTNNPLLYLALGGLALEAFSRRSGRSLARPLGMCFLTTAYIIACAWDWWGAAGYPGRRFCDHTVTFVLGGAFFASRFEHWLRHRAQRATVVLAGAVVMLAALWSRSYVAQGGGRSSALVGEWAGGVLLSIDDRVGNPLAWPGSLPFALRHRVHPNRWDRMSYFAVTWEDPMSREQLNRTLSPAREDHAPFFVSGFWPLAKVDGVDSRNVCSEPGRLLVPLFRSNIVRLVVRWRPLPGFRGPLQLRWNGEMITIAEAGLMQWNAADVNVRASMFRRGPNDGELIVTGGCVALGEIDFFKDNAP